LVVTESDTKHFGVPLRESLQKAANSGQPHIVLFAIEYLLRYGVEVEGIFREGAAVTAIAKLKSKVDDGTPFVKYSSQEFELTFITGQPIAQEDHSSISVHNIAGLLKVP